MAQVAERALVTDLALESDHLEDFTRYRFACGFVSSKRVLDVACGSGYGSALLWREGGASCVIGVDASWDALQAAQRFQVPGHVRFAMGSAEQLIIDKEGQLQFELTQNPWQLVGILDWTSKGKE